VASRPKVIIHALAPVGRDTGGGGCAWVPAQKLLHAHMRQVDRYTGWQRERERDGGGETGGRRGGKKAFHLLIDRRLRKNRPIGVSRA